MIDPDALLTITGLISLASGILLALRRTVLLSGMLIFSGVLLVAFTHPSFQQLSVSKSSFAIVKGAQKELLQQIADLKSASDKQTILWHQQDDLNQKLLAVLPVKNSNGEAPTMTPVPTAPERASGRNDKYKVIVYYKKDQRDLAYKLKDRLALSGYRSSALESDLSEYSHFFDKNEKSSGRINIGWDGAGKEIVGDVEKTVLSTPSRPPNDKIKTHGDPWDLEGTDVEVLLY